MEEDKQKPRTRMIEIAVVQSVFGFLFSLMLDGGELSNCYLIAVAAYWASVLILACRRRFKLGRRDVMYINYAWLVILPVGTLVGLYVHSRVGL